MTQINQNKRMMLRSREAKNAWKTLDLERLSQLTHKNAQLELVAKLLVLKNAQLELSTKLLML